MNRAWYFFPIAVFLLFLTVMLFVMRRRQSACEVAADERDKLIRSRAVAVTLMYLILMLCAQASFLYLISNEECMVSATITIPLALLILLMALAVFSIATLVQYGLSSLKLRHDR